MKIIILAVATFIGATPQAHALFGHVEAERERRIGVEHQLAQQQQISNRWEGTAFIFGVGCIITLVAGAAIGSNGRKNAKSK